MKAQAQAIIARVRNALDELEDTMDTLPGDGEVVIDGGRTDTAD